LTFPPQIFGQAKTRKNQNASIKRADIPIIFRKSRGSVVVAHIDLVIDTIDPDPDKAPNRQVAQQYVLIIRGHNGQLALKQVDRTASTVEPLFLTQLSFSADGEDADAEDDDLDLLSDGGVDYDDDEDDEDAADGITDRLPQ